MNMQPELQPVRSNTSGIYGTAISAESQKVLRNTYLLLALTMVPTIAGAYLGMATSSILIQNPIISTLVMLAAVIGLQFAIVANRNSMLGVAFLLLMTGLLGWFLGPLLNYTLALKNGALLIAMFANMFLQIPALALTISTLVIVVFSLFLLHDLSRIVTGGETNYIMATTGVYLSLFNIFANLLQILGIFGGSRD